METYAFYDKRVSKILDNAPDVQINEGDDTYCNDEKESSSEDGNNGSNFRISKGDDKYIDSEKKEILESIRGRFEKRKNESSYLSNCLFTTSEGGRIYRFDLVELCKEGRIRKVYELCSMDDFNHKLNVLYKKLLIYQDITKSDVFLIVRLDLDRKHYNYIQYLIHKKIKLEIVSLSRIKKLIEEKPQNWYKVCSFSDYYSVLQELGIVKASLKLSKLTLGNYCFFRGHANNKYEAIPGIYRGDNISNENRIYHEAIRRMPDWFPENSSTFDNLVKMQHYGLPTRLLDITTNPLVALYFACQEAKENGNSVDGEVLVYSMEQKDVVFFDDDSVNNLANIVKKHIDTPYLSSYEYKPNEKKKDNPSLENNSEQLNRVLCVLPKLNNNRIRNQDGAFFLFGIKESFSEPASIPALPQIINIDANAKQDILYELSFLGINEARLFPGIEKTIEQIKKEYHGLGDLNLAELFWEKFFNTNWKWHNKNDDNIHE